MKTTISEYRIVNVVLEDGDNDLTILPVYADKIYVTNQPYGPVLKVCPKCGKIGRVLAELYIDQGKILTLHHITRNGDEFEWDKKGMCWTNA